MKLAVYVKDTVWEVSTESDQDNLIYQQFPNGSHVFSPILLICNINVYLSIQRLYTKFGVDTVKIPKTFFTLCKLAKNPSWWPLLPKQLFRRAHLVSCVLNLKSIGLTGWDGWPFKVFTFLAVNCATVRSMGTIFLL